MMANHIGQLTEAETQVYFLLRKFRVQKHYRATAAMKATRYAVWAHGGGQITEPATSAEARAAADLLTAKEIVRALAPALADADRAPPPLSQDPL